VPATAVPIASDAEAQQADQAAPADAGFKKENEEEKRWCKRRRCVSGKTEGTVNVSAFKLP
jgi:hypothetical protein